MTTVTFTEFRKRVKHHGVPDQPRDTGDECEGREVIASMCWPGRARRVKTFHQL